MFIDKKDRLGKFARQIAAIASLIDAWWLWAVESLDDYKIDDECKKMAAQCPTAICLLAESDGKDQKS